jgi:threonine dehydratase
VIRVAAEPGGAAAFAALLSGRYQTEKRERVGVVVSGGNTVAVDFRALKTGDPRLISDNLVLLFAPTHPHPRRRLYKSGHLPERNRRR